MNYPLTVIRTVWRRIRRPSPLTVQMMVDRPSPELVELYQHLIKDMQDQVGIPDSFFKEMRSFSRKHESWR